jgi:ABC-type branched-subunit amino acid transport system substrate-binding protein
MKLGGIGPLSGEAAFLGENTLNYGARLAVDAANANGGVLGQDVQLVVQDDERRTEGAVSGFRNLMSQNVHAGVGPTSATIPGVLDLIKAAKVPWIPIGGTPSLDQGLEGTMVYRNFPSDSMQIPAMLLHAAENGTRVGIVFENNASGQGQREEALKYLQGNNEFELVDELLLAPGQSSYRSEVSKFFSQEYDAILWQLTDATAASFFANAQELGALEGQYFVGTDAALAEATIEILKPYLDQATFTAVAPAVQGAGLEVYRELYREKFGEEPIVLADIGYDAATVLMLAAEQAGSLEPQAIAEAIPQVTSGGTLCVSFAECAELIRNGEDVDFDGAGNSITFDETHNVTAPYTVSALNPDGSVEEAATIEEERIRDLVETAQ